MKSAQYRTARSGLFCPLFLALLLGCVALTTKADDRVSFPDSVNLPSAAQFKGIAPRTVGVVDPGGSIEFMVALKMRNFSELTDRVAAGEIISSPDMDARYNPLPEDYEATVAWLIAQGFTVTSTDPGRLGIFVTGGAAQVQQALGISLAKVEFEGETYTAAVSAPSLPASIATPILGINGLQPYLQAHPLSHLVDPAALSNNAPPYKVGDVTRVYYANTLSQTGAGQTIGIVIDTFPAQSDVTQFWVSDQVSQSWSNVNLIQCVAGVLPSPYVATSNEVALDVEWSSSIAPGAKVNVYAATDFFPTHFDQCYQRILTDAASQSGLRQISLSFGLGETYQATAQMTTDSQYFAKMAAAGISVFVASGDGGSSPSMEGHDHGGAIQVEWPANDPSVTAVGGTNLELFSSTGTLSDETAWYDGGGGISNFFARPTWQTGAGVPSGSRRTVPDVALVASPSADLYWRGAVTGVAGTSWSAPTWAGFCALINQARAAAGLAPVGSLGPKLYPLLGTPNFRDIISGSNGPAGAYNTTSAYDLCTGLGVPNVAQLLQTLTAGSTPPTSPNLTSNKPTGWSDAIVVSKVMGTNVDGTALATTDTLYVDWAAINNGTGSTGVTFNTQLLVDGALNVTFSSGGAVGAGSGFSYQDWSIGSLAAGTHTIQIKLDSSGVVAESNENDNVYTKTITVGTPSVPNLTPAARPGWSDKIVVANVTGGTQDSATLSTTDTLYVDWAAINNGTAATGASFSTQLLVDGVLNVTFTTNGSLPTGNYASYADWSIGSLGVGSHTIKLVVDSGNVVPESNEGDNTYTKTITVSSASHANLAAYVPSNWSDDIVVSNVTGTHTDSSTFSTSDTLYVDWAAINNGPVASVNGFAVQLLVDNVVKATFSSPELEPSYYIYYDDWNIGSLAAGTPRHRGQAGHGERRHREQQDRQYLQPDDHGQHPHPPEPDRLPAGPVVG